MQWKRTSLTVGSVLVIAREADAHARYALLIPNGSNVPGTSAVGHSDPNGGGSLNPFGVAFLMAFHSWTLELCQADSDGDGQTNGQELGDPCCEWTSASLRFPRWSDGISHPGDATKTSNASRWAGLLCSTSPNEVSATVFVT